MAKADLIKDAKKRGIALTGDETVAELEALLEGNGEPEAQAEAEAAVPDPDAEAAAEAVAKATQDVADAKEKLAEAVIAHQEAVAALAEANKPPLPIYGQHLVIEGGGQMDMPKDWNGQYQFRLVQNGVIYDHVGETPGVDAEGKPAMVWVYRRG